MWGLEKIADAFDKIHAEVQHDLDGALLVKGGQWAGEQFGPDSVYTWGTAIAAGTAWSLATFVLGAGKSLVDVLRLGEGVKSGTLGGVGHDALRVLNIIPAAGMVGKGLGMGGRFATLAWAGRAAGLGGDMACGPTAITTSLRLSGSSVAITVDEVGVLAGKGVSPFSPQFPGLFWHEITPIVKGITPLAQDLDMTGKSLADVEAVAAQGRGPVLFGVQWWGKGAGQLTEPLGNAGINWGAGDHWMTAFRALKGDVMVADQFGIRPIAQAGVIGGTTSELTVSSKALLVGDGTIVNGLRTMQNVGTAMTGAQGGRGALAASFAIQMVVVNGQQTQILDNAVREKLGRPPRDWTQPTEDLGLGGGGSGSGKSSTGHSSRRKRVPLASPPIVRADAWVPLSSLPPEAQRLYNSLPPEVPVNWKQAIGSIVPPLSDPYGSLQLLEKAGRVMVARFGRDDLNIATVTRL
jgi:hypothetical protein